MRSMCVIAIVIVSLIVVGAYATFTESYGLVNNPEYSVRSTIPVITRDMKRAMASTIPPREMLVSSARPVSVDRSVQREALQSIFLASGGLYWTNSSGWRDATANECTWFGVTCSTDQAVVLLELASNNLTGLL
jgi:hypothetical protein